MEIERNEQIYHKVIRQMELYQDLKYSNSIIELFWSLCSVGLREDQISCRGDILTIRFDKKNDDIRLITKEISENGWYIVEEKELIDGICFVCGSKFDVELIGKERPRKLFCLIKKDNVEKIKNEKLDYSLCEKPDFAKELDDRKIYFFQENGLSESRDIFKYYSCVNECVILEVDNSLSTIRLFKDKKLKDFIYSFDEIESEIITIITE